MPAIVADGGMTDIGTDSPRLSYDASGPPTPAASILSRQAQSPSSLYQSCVQLRKRLTSVPGFSAEFLERAYPPTPTLSTPSTPDSVSSFTSSSASAPFSDPVSHLWQCFRLGSPLCVLFNLYAVHTNQAPIPLTVESKLSELNSCKALVMRFVIALKERFGWEPDQTFTVSQLYLNDTNGFVRVVRTVDRLLDVMNQVGLLMPPAPERPSLERQVSSTRDKREWISKELLESERKYVHDMEVLQNYVSMLGSTDTLPSDTIYRMFGNLDQLVDVQRRFLIYLEESAEQPVEHQRLGHIFHAIEEEFSVYESYCANYPKALESITELLPTLSQVGQRSSAQQHYLEPTYELPNYLIKPVQRICKYPLFLEQLLKSTPEQAPERGELSTALTTIRRITDKVNETQRAQENKQLVHELERRVEDWKGHSLKTFGALLLSDTFVVSKGESEREFRVYLFERILLCCKDLSLSQPMATTPSRSRSKSGSRLRQRSASVSEGSVSKRASTAPLQLKGRIFMNNIVGIHVLTKTEPTEPPHTLYALQAWWRGEAEVESFCLKCRNEEQLRLWQASIQKLLDEVRLRRESASTSTSALPSQASTPTTPYPSAVNPLQQGRGAFMQVSTPVVSMPNEMWAMRAPTSRSSSGDDHSEMMIRSRSNSSAAVGPVPAQLSRLITEDAVQSDGTPSPLDGADTPVSKSALSATPGTPGSTTAGLPSGTTPTPVLLAASRLARRQMSLTQASTPPMAAFSPPARAASLSMPHHSFRSNTEFLEKEMSAMKLNASSPQVPPPTLRGFAAARGGPSPLRLDSALMQRTASDSMAMRSATTPGPGTANSMFQTPMFGMTPHQAPMTDAGTMPQSPGGTDWNSYFPVVPSTSSHGSSTAPVVPTPNMRTASMQSYMDSPFASQLPSGAQTPSDAPGMEARHSNASSFSISAASIHSRHRSETHSPARGSMLLVRIKYGTMRTELAVPTSIPFATLNTSVHESVGLPPHAHTRMYHIDNDGDRVMLLDDDDMATAMEYARRHEHILPLVIE
ncbi:cdc24-gtp gdp exchange factor for cdc42p [Malassezia pachydermatis]|uniref:Cdc24-gtp gdp exchange factor for cdc42p n=1 Tax=Malassezia pachydermatis TaxID=77020 RepID=A0A0M8MWT0_9BASI|nr:cdc24-gtp gdp exchange factor for cdc42p [Malassezia pachydermatis]KOS15864.1 cdc24-gtp gdp exchange factor for cdc42p [Malassezia pachydermatis]